MRLALLSAMSLFVLVGCGSDPSGADLVMIGDLWPNGDSLEWHFEGTVSDSFSTTQTGFEMTFGTPRQLTDGTEVQFLASQQITALSLMPAGSFLKTADELAKYGPYRIGGILEFDGDEKSWIWLRSGLTIGDSFTFGSLTVSYVGWEDVTTPAGTFPRSLRVEYCYDQEQPVFPSQCSQGSNIQLKVVGCVHYSEGVGPVSIEEAIRITVVNGDCGGLWVGKTMSERSFLLVSGPNT